jgi:transcriptional regulator with XRE-family HTH domain
MREVGQLLRDWRTTRRMSQLELSVQAGVSARHLSFLETGRSRPTREMILRLAEELAVPLRSQNELLLAGGFAPAYGESDLNGPPLAAVLSSLRDVLAGHAPYPAVLVDRHWTMVDANDAVARLTDGCAARLLEPPVNVLRLSLHPDGMAPRIRNLAEWRAHILHRLDRQAAATADPALRDLYAELAAYPSDAAAFAVCNQSTGGPYGDGAVNPASANDPDVTANPGGGTHRAAGGHRVAVGHQLDGKRPSREGGPTRAESTRADAARSAGDGGRVDGFVVPLRFAVGERTLSFFSITSVLGTPLDVTLSELAIESFLPADAATAAALHGR